MNLQPNTHQLLRSKINLTADDTTVVSGGTLATESYFHTTTSSLPLDLIQGWTLAQTVIEYEESKHPTLELALGDMVIKPHLQERQTSIEKAALIFKEILQGIEGIEGILGKQGTEQGPLLSVIVNRAPKSRRREIYDCEMQLMQRLDTGFDFRLIDRRDQPIQNITSIELYDIYLRT